MTNFTYEKRCEKDSSKFLYNDDVCVNLSKVIYILKDNSSSLFSLIFGFDYGYERDISFYNQEERDKFYDSCIIALKANKCYEEE